MEELYFIRPKIIDGKLMSVDDVLNEIRTKILNDIHKCNNTDIAFGMRHTLYILDKYKSESEE